MPEGLVVPALLVLSVALAACEAAPTDPGDEGLEPEVQSTIMVGTTPPIETVYDCPEQQYYPWYDCSSGDSGEEGSDSDGGGGTDSGTGTDNGACDPRDDPDCEQPLTADDLTRLRRAWQTYFREIYIDDEKADVCHRLMARFKDMLEAGRVFRGGTDLPDDPHPDSHRALYYELNGHIHFDPEHLDSGRPRDLLNSALHEAAHSFDYDHPRGEVGGFYLDWPYNLLQPGTDTCIK